MSDKLNELEANKIFESFSGNSGLTEEFIYTKTQDKGVSYKVLSGSVLDENQLGHITKGVMRNNRSLKVYENKQGILVVRKGKAGTMRYLQPDNYTVTDDAYILSIRDDFKKTFGIDTTDDEKYFLLWFVFTYQLKMYELASNSDNSTWNKTNFLTSKLFIPPKDEINQIAEMYSDALAIISKSNKVKANIEIK